jgi:hypothetical protein
MWVFLFYKVFICKMKIVITESQLRQLKENYDPDKLYKKSYVVNILKKAPRQYKKYITNLDEHECYDSEGNKHECVKVPQFIYQYLIGNY